VVTPGVVEALRFIVPLMLAIELEEEEARGEPFVSSLAE
jgi:hypothetical protein